MKNDFIGKYVIVRCRDAGVHAGVLVDAKNRWASLDHARRLWSWQAITGHTLSGVARYGIDHNKSKIAGPVRILLTETCEIIQTSNVAEDSIRTAPEYKA